MVIAKKVVRRKPPPDWVKGLDDIIRRKRPVKLILLHTCKEGEEFAVNPELILEIGNTVENLEEDVGPGPDIDQAKILQSRAATDPQNAHEAVLYLDRQPFKVGQRIKFSGLTRLPSLNGVSLILRAKTSPGIADFQVQPGDNKTLIIHNFTTKFPFTPMGPETGIVTEVERNVTCGFVSCCGGAKIETRESMEMILLMIMRAGIGTIYDPTGAIDRLASEEIGQ